MDLAFGEDRSEYQPELPWVDREGAPLSFGFAKATEADRVDPTFRRNWANLKLAGIPRGACLLFHPNLDVNTQIELFATVVTEQGLEPGDLLLIDSELYSDEQDTLMLAAQHRSVLLFQGSNSEAEIRPSVNYPYHLLTGHLANKFAAKLIDEATRKALDALRDIVEFVAGGPHCPVVCGANSPVSVQLTSCTEYPLWITQDSGVNNIDPGPWDSWRFWRYATGAGNLGSDADAFHGTADELRSWLNSFME